MNEITQTNAEKRWKFQGGGGTKKVTMMNYGGGASARKGHFLCPACEIWDLLLFFSPKRKKEGNLSFAVFKYRKKVLFTDALKVPSIPIHKVY